MQEPTIHHKGVDWWSDEEEKETKSTENVECNVQEQAKDGKFVLIWYHVDNLKLEQFQLKLHLSLVFEAYVDKFLE